ncbi:hypothetical protein ACOME3_010394 [Neoechinorhynchus agilis]
MGQKPGIPQIIVMSAIRQPFVNYTMTRHINSCGGRYNNYKDYVYQYHQLYKLMAEGISKLQTECNKLKGVCGLAVLKNNKRRTKKQKKTYKAKIYKKILKLLLRYIHEFKNIPYLRAPNNYLMEKRKMKKRCDKYERGMEIVLWKMTEDYPKFYNFMGETEALLQELKTKNLKHFSKKKVQKNISRVLKKFLKNSGAMPQR